MIINYFSTLISDDLYKKLYVKESKPGMQVQVFNRLIVEGLLLNKADVRAYSQVPTSKKILDKTYIKLKNEEHIKYFNIINIPILKDVIIILKSFFIGLFSKTRINVLDVLSFSNCLGIILASKIRKLECIGIVTDIPELFETNKLYIRLTNYIIKNCTSYIFLTEDMNTYINKKNKPYRIIEGLCSDFSCENEEKRKKAFLYAGSLDKINGIDRLLEAFVSLDTDYYLYIFGDGDQKDNIIETSKKHQNVKYMGLLPHKEIKEHLCKVSFLVNPRGLDNPMVKYSFPSKTMEYLASGTPFITTKLPCIPLDYFTYLNTFESDDVDGIREGLKNLLIKNYSNLLLKAKNGRNFVLTYKNNRVQTQKILDLIGRK